MAQIRDSAIAQEHALGRLAAASPLIDKTRESDAEERDGDETSDEPEERKE